MNFYERGLLKQTLFSSVPFVGSSSFFNFGCLLFLYGFALVFSCNFSQLEATRGFFTRIADANQDALLHGMEDSTTNMETEFLDVGLVVEDDELLDGR